MIAREQYTPGPASGAQVRKDGDTRSPTPRERLSPQIVWLRSDRVRDLYNANRIRRVQ
jgi:hypothetical protein